ncbi:type II toxin-antitoxin system RelE family toxin [Campylobacter concisus]
MRYELEFLPSALKEWQKLDKNLKYLLFKFTTTSQIQKI